MFSVFAWSLYRLSCIDVQKVCGFSRQLWCLILILDKTYHTSYEFLFGWCIPCIHEELATILHSNIVPLATSSWEVLSKIDNDNIRKILTKGPKYREPQSINWKYNFKLLIDSVEDYARTWTNEKKRRLKPFQNGSKLWGRLFKFESENSKCQWAQKQHMFSKIPRLQYSRNICCISCR